MKRLFVFLLLLALPVAIPLSAAAQDVTDYIAEYYEHEETGLSLPYRLILPNRYKENGSFPLVVFLHGAGERGYENKRQLDNCVQQIADNMPNAIILAPQCTHNNQWVDTPWSDGSYSTEDIPESYELEAVMSLVKQICNDYAVDTQRVYAMGISMGGYGVWDLMIRHNDVFAAGVAVCGAGDPSKAETLKDTPMFVFHGNGDDTVPVTGSTDMVDAIQAIGGSKAEYTEYDGAGHGIWGEVFSTPQLYAKVQGCKLSDHYISNQESGQNIGFLPYLITFAVGITVIASVTILIKRKQKASA